MKRPSHLALAIAASLILLASVFTFRRYLPYSGSELAPKKPPEVVLAMEDAYLVGLGHNGKLWSVKAKKVEIGQNRSNTTLTSITDGKILDKGKTVLKVKAGNALYNTFNENLWLRGGVEVCSMDGQRISSKGAHWNPWTSTLRSTGQVTYQTKESTVTTEKLVANLKNRQLEMWQVKMSFKLTNLENGPVQEAVGNAQ